jgi:1,4-alpha-glucan branching enzyme
MSLKKQYIKNKTVCKVSFRVHKKDTLDTKQIFLVGDFNQWHETATPMRQLKNGDFIVALDLEPGREYQFKYYFDRMAWRNDTDADGYIHSDYGNCDNSVVNI